MNNVISSVKRFQKRHPDLYEFILFNIMSNAATITNFIVLWLGTGILFRTWSDLPFHWFIFNYSTANGGMGGFISFLVAYVCAQIVNFFVQRDIVFKASNSIMQALPWYIGTVVVAGLVSIWLPPHVIAFVQPYVGGLAATVANIVNIVLQVIINYPMLKFKVMRKG